MAAATGAAVPEINRLEREGREGGEAAEDAGGQEDAQFLLAEGAPGRSTNQDATIP